jgi:ADP-heptose:LPS heptosyltransferase
MNEKFINVLKWITIEIIILLNNFRKQIPLENKIAIIISAGIGDNLLLVKLINYLKNKNPRTSIVIFTKKNSKEIHICNQNVDEVIVFEEIPREKIIEEINLCGKIYSIRTPFWLVVKLFTNYKGSIEFNPLYERFRLYSRIKSILSKKYKKDFYSIMHISNLFIPTNEMEFLKKNTFKFNSNTESCLPKIDSQTYILVHTGGYDQIRKLLPSTIKTLIEKINFFIVLVGEQSSDNYSEMENCLDLRGKTSLTDLNQLIDSALCVIAPDSMIMHMTCFTETPLVAMMGNALQETYGPIRSDSKTIILNKSPNCSPCSKVNCGKYAGVSCVQSIDPFDIIESVNTLIK